jgi:DNA helicase-2/ATP-dependent DNA helicase PcrA
MNYASLLNEKQLAAVQTGSQYVRIVAGAGSGKTRVLTYRISYLISDLHVDPSRILAIAFTNKVAQEMMDRASKLVNDLLGYTPMLHISTFHSFCARFLRIECQAIGFPSGFTIFDEDDQMRLIKNCAVEVGYKKSDDIVKQAIQYIREKKTKGIYPEDINIKFEAFHDEKECFKIYLLYEDRFLCFGF